MDDPGQEGVRLLGEPEIEEGLERQRGVAQPAVAVVPVARAADRLGQRGRGRRHHRSRGGEGEELQGQGAADNVVAVGSVVAAARRPPAPPREARLDPAPGLLAEGRQDRRLLVGEGDREVAALAGAEGRGAVDAGAVLARGEGDLAAQAQGVGGVLVPEAEGAAVGQPGDHRAVAGPRVARDLDLHLALHALDRAQHLALGPELPALLLLGGHREEVEQAHPSALGGEGGLEHVGVGHVAPGGLETARRADGEAPALVTIENGGEERRRVEARQAEPVDRPPFRDQGGAPAVADDGVVADGRVVGLVVRVAIRHGSAEWKRDSCQGRPLAGPVVPKPDAAGRLRRGAYHTTT